MKAALLDSPDNIHARMVANNAKELARWGAELREDILINVAKLTFDGRRRQRNWDLIDALRRDPRFEIRHEPGTHFSQTRIVLRA
jgi:hypothetical protein